MPVTPSDGCTFCRIIGGESSHGIVFADAHSLAFLDHRPLLRGHCLLIPRQHVETFHDLHESLIAPLFANAQLLARAVERGLRADGSFVAINTRISQSVPHLHIHVVPRWKKDGLFSNLLLWRRRPYKNEQEMADVRKAIRDTIDKLRAEHPAHLP
jgi:histidine triad (HIT) family protein